MNINLKSQRQTDRSIHHLLIQPNPLIKLSFFSFLLTPTYSATASRRVLLVRYRTYVHRKFGSLDTSATDPLKGEKAPPNPTKTVPSPPTSAEPPRICFCRRLVLTVTGTTLITRSMFDSLATNHILPRHQYVINKLRTKQEKYVAFYMHVLFV